MLTWLRRSPATRLLGQLAAHPGDLTHDAHDALPQGESTTYVRGLLANAGILAARDKNFALLTRWLARALTKLLPAHVTLIRAFAEWHVLRDARRRSAHGRYTYAYAAYREDSVNIRAATRVLAWLDERHLTLITLQQKHLDTWASGNPTLRAGSIPFIRWAVARGLTTALAIAHPPTRPPSQFQVDDIQQEELRQCLTDRSLPRDVRIAGALTRLYALALTRIVELTTDHLHRDANDAYLTISRRPVILPQSLAQLIEEQIKPPRPSTGWLTRMVTCCPVEAPAAHAVPQGWPTPCASTVSPSAPRNTAMMQSLADLPPIVIADLFGIAPGTAHRWAQLASNSWSNYLAALPDITTANRPS